MPPFPFTASAPKGKYLGNARMRRKTLGLTMLITLFSASVAFWLHHADAQSKVTSPAQVDTARLIAADREPGNWMTYSRTYSEQRFSPLNQISASNVANLKLAWYYDLDTARGQEATPLVVDGVMYVSTAWSMVKAL